MCILCLNMQIMERYHVDQKYGKLPLELTKFYAAEIITYWSTTYSRSCSSRFEAREYIDLFDYLLNCKLNSFMQITNAYIVRFRRCITAG